MTSRRSCPLKRRNLPACGLKARACHQRDRLYHPLFRCGGLQRGRTVGAPFPLPDLREGADEEPERGAADRPGAADLRRPEFRRDGLRAGKRRMRDQVHRFLQRTGEEAAGGDGAGGGDPDGDGLRSGEHRPRPAAAGEDPRTWKASSWAAIRSPSAGWGHSFSPIG